MAFKIAISTICDHCHGVRYCVQVTIMVYIRDMCRGVFYRMYSVAELFKVSKEVMI